MLATRAMAIALIAALFVPAIARAQTDDATPTNEPPAAEPAAEPPTSEPPARDWSKAPPADQASGVESGDDAGDGLRWVPRVLLFVPKWTLVALASPVRLGVWAYERYQLPDRFERIFFNVDGTFGVFPTAFFETRFGLNVGARLVHRDLFGKNEGLRLRVGFGGKFEQRAEASLSSGDRLSDRVSLDLRVLYEKRPKDLFFGIGNGDETAAGQMLDPLTDDRQVRSQFRQNVLRASLRASVDLGAALTLLPTASIVTREFRDRGIAENFDVSRLPAFETDASNVYGELELRYDTRDRSSRYATRAIDGQGWLVAAHAGWQQGFADDPSSFLRYGADVQHFIDLYRGTRVLGLRLYLDAVKRTEGAVAEVPFVDLPRLGGMALLRGYDANRFRDRIAALGSAEYSWDIGLFGAGYAFVDVGRTYRQWSELGTDDWRVGFGGGLQLHTSASFLARFQLATSIDGGLFLNLVVNPAFGRQERVGRI